MARKEPPKAVPKALRVRKATHAGSGEGGGGGAGGAGGGAGGDGSGLCGGRGGCGGCGGEGLGDGAMKGRCSKVLVVA